MREKKKDACKRPFSLCLSGCVGGVPRGFLTAPEEQCDAPDSGKAHQCVDHAGEYGHLAAAEKGHRVEAEQADAAPVEGTDNGQDQRQFIQQHFLNLQSAPWQEFKPRMTHGVKNIHAHCAAAVCGV